MQGNEEQHRAMYEDALSHSKGNYKLKHAYEWFKRPSYYQVYKEIQNERRNDNKTDC